MKKKISFLLLVAALLTASIYANPVDENLSGNVLATFSRSFNGASEVTWSKTTNYVKASFTLNNQSIAAYFSHQGELIGTSKNLLSTQLPVNLQLQLKKISGKHWITELFEFSTDDQTTYYATLEDADEKVYLQSDFNNAWSVAKKIKKD